MHEFKMLPARNHYDRQMTPDPHQLWRATFAKKMRGYSPEEVDAFLHSIAARLAAGDSPSPDEITDSRFEFAL